jgi:hypothetical protein
MKQTFVLKKVNKKHRLHETGGIIKLEKYLELSKVKGGKEKSE